MRVVHTFVSGKEDPPDATLVKASDWNADHTIIDPPVIPPAVIFVDSELPSGVIDSTTGSDGNGVFTLANPANPVTSVNIVISGVVQLQGLDYVVQFGNQIQYTSGRYPKVGQWHRAWYRR